jgi:antitoxin ParD1/3/4
VSVSLPDELAEQVRRKVAEGLYGSPDEVLRQALRLLDRHDAEEAGRLSGLRKAWSDGLASGDAGELDSAAVAAEARARRAAQG